MSDDAQVDTLCQQAKQALKAKDLTEALELYDQAIAVNDRSVTAHEGRARVAFAQRDFDTAIKHFKLVQKIDPRRKNTLINLGATYNSAGKHKDAVLTLQKGIAKDRTSAEAYYNLGIAHRALKQNSMAVTAYKEAIRLDPKMVETKTAAGATQPDRLARDRLRCCGCR